MSWLSGILSTLSPIVGSFFGPVGTAVGTGLGAAISSSPSAQEQLESEQNYNSTEAEKNRQFQRDERLAAQEYNLQMWNLNNEYNSPVEQLKRAQAAGINPNAIFGNGYSPVQSSAVTTSPMSGNVAAASPSIANTLLTSDAVVANLLAENRNIEADTANKEYELNWNKATEAERLKLLCAEGDKILSDIGMNEFSKEMQEKTFSYFAKKTDKELEVMSAQITVLYNQSKDILKGIELKDAQIKNTNADTEVLQSDKKLKDAQMDSIDVDTQLKEIELSLADTLGMPVDTPEFSAMWAMFKEGRIEEFLNAASISASQKSHAYNELKGAQRFTSDIIERLKSVFLTLPPPSSTRNPR